MIANFTRRTFANLSFKAPNVAIVLSGSGVYDGSEITEGIATLVHLSRFDATFQCYAPDKMQLHAVDHSTGTEHEESRNVLQESARIARGDVKALDELQESNYDAIIFPGGFGAAKNLSTWATEGIDGSVDLEVEKAIQSFHAAGKPIGACCIAPVLVGKCIPGCTLTVGSGDTSDEENWPYAGTVSQLEALGCVHETTDIHGVTIDVQNKIVTSPAYMYNGKPHEVFDSVGQMVEGVLKFAFGAKLAEGTKQ